MNPRKTDAPMYKFGKNRSIKIGKENTPAAKKKNTPPQ
jgi:hypothetical protein